MFAHVRGFALEWYLALSPITEEREWEIPSEGPGARHPNEKRDDASVRAELGGKRSADTKRNLHFHMGDGLVRWIHSGCQHTPREGQIESPQVTKRLTALRWQNGEEEMDGCPWVTSESVLDLCDYGSYRRSRLQVLAKPV
jgi:hypothetical protein